MDRGFLVLLGLFSECGPPGGGDVPQGREPFLASGKVRPSSSSRSFSRPIVPTGSAWTPSSTSCRRPSSRAVGVDLEEFGALFGRSRPVPNWVAIPKRRPSMRTRSGRSSSGTVARVWRRPTWCAEPAIAPRPSPSEKEGTPVRAANACSCARASGVTKDLPTSAIGRRAVPSASMTARRRHRRGRHRCRRPRRGGRRPRRRPPTGAGRPRECPGAPAPWAPIARCGSPGRPGAGSARCG
ncbi:hypothetical protein SALBM311S_12507 [Streptomyces alboniger]